MRIYISLLLFVILLPISFTLSAQDTEPTAYLRLIHLAPDAPALDLYIDDETVVVTDLGYTQGSEWLALPVGRYQAVLTPTGSGLERAVIAPTRLSLTVDSWTTAALIGSAENRSLTLDTFPQDMSPISFGGSRLVFYHAVEQGSTVNIIRDGVTFVPALPYGGDSALLTNAGTYGFQFVRSGDLSFQLAEFPALELQPTTYYLIALAGSSLENVQPFIFPTDRAEVEIAMGSLEAPGTVVETVASDLRTTEFRRAIEVAALTEQLRGEGPYTIFVPVEIALTEVVMTDTTAMASIVEYHIVEGEIYGSQLEGGTTLTTLSGESLQVRFDEGRLNINGARLIETDLAATNGVVHLIDTVLLPPVAE
jgi:uncharacterized surface protein with fasciclin (FAS1) repeats